MGTQHYRRFVIETSLKPFKRLDPESIAATCERLFTNWERLIERADEVCVLRGMAWSRTRNCQFRWAVESYSGDLYVLY